MKFLENWEIGFIHGMQTCLGYGNLSASNIIWNSRICCEISAITLGKSKKEFREKLRCHEHFKNFVTILSTRKLWWRHMFEVSTDAMNCNASVHLLEKVKR